MDIRKRSYNDTALKQCVLLITHDVFLKIIRMNPSPRLFPTLNSSGFCSKQNVFLPQSAQRFAQSAQRGYGVDWCSTTTEIVNAQRAGAAHREADGGEYHPAVTSNK